MSLPETVVAACIYRGDDWAWVVQLYAAYDPNTETFSDPVDLTAYGTSWLSQARPSERSATAYAITVDASQAATGQLVLSMAHSLTEDLPSKLVYDVQATDSGGKRTTIIKGPMCVDGDVSRA